MNLLCIYYKELVLYTYKEHFIVYIQWTRNVYNKILFIEYILDKNNVM